MLQKKIGEWFLNLLYPVRCPVCSQIVVPRGNRICISCKEKLVYVEEPMCKKCGKPILVKEQEYCYDCTKRQFHFEYGCSVWVYNQYMKKSIADFKYHNKKEYVTFYVDELVKYCGKKIRHMDISAIIPVPLHKKRQRQRSYNQAELLAKGVGERMEIPVITGYLLRKKNTIPQKALNDKERIKNLEQAFQIEQKKIKQFACPDNVLLVDDIYTTGSTIEACSNVLIKSGVKKVFFISLCIGKGY